MALQTSKYSRLMANLVTIIWPNRAPVGKMLVSTSRHLIFQMSEGLICAFISWRLQHEHPEHFDLEEKEQG